jgi:nucleoid-associated protein YgaU
MAYDFFVGDVQLPIAPPSLSVRIRNQNKSIALINEGEVNILKTAGLSEISFDARIPQTRFPFASYPDGFKGADYFLHSFKRLKIEKTPFYFKVSRVLPNGRSLFDTEIKVSLEDYEIKENADDGFDVVVSVKLKEYRDYGTKTVRIIPASATPSATPIAQATIDRPADPPKKTSYTAVAGDCLWNIAKKYLGDGARYTEIYDLNKDRIKNPNLIYAGQVLAMP